MKYYLKSDLISEGGFTEEVRALLESGPEKDTEKCKWCDDSTRMPGHDSCPVCFNLMLVLGTSDLDAAEKMIDHLKKAREISTFARKKKDRKGKHS